MSPIYEYECTKHNHKFEKLFALTSSVDKPVKCPKCGSKSERVFSVGAKRNPDHGIQR